VNVSMLVRPGGPHTRPTFGEVGVGDGPGVDVGVGVTGVGVSVGKSPIGVEVGVGDGVGVWKKVCGKQVGWKKPFCAVMFTGTRPT
jgi:hypothetical protein